MKKSIILFLSIFLLLSCSKNNGSFECKGIVAGGQYHLVEVISKHLKENYKYFEDGRVVGSTYRGKTFFSLPGCVPTYYFYEIVEPSDIESLELLNIDRVRVYFYERQVMNCINNACSRGSEKLIKSMSIERPNLLQK